MKKSLSFYISKILICIVITLTILIITSLNSNIKKKVENLIKTSTFNFMDFKTSYEKIINYQNNKVKSVVGTSFSYLSKEDFYNGEKFIIGDNEVIRPLKEGIVIFIGQKDEYKNTIIVQCSNGFDIWYGNISNINVSLYDYIDTNNIIGEANNEFYLLITKDGEYYSYEEYSKI